MAVAFCTVFVLVQAGKGNEVLPDGQSAAEVSCSSALSGKLTDIRVFKFAVSRISRSTTSRAFCFNYSTYFYLGLIINPKPCFFLKFLAEGIIYCCKMGMFLITHIGFQIFLVNHAMSAHHLNCISNLG